MGRQGARQGGQLLVLYPLCNPRGQAGIFHLSILQHHRVSTRATLVPTLVPKGEDTR